MNHLIWIGCGALVVGLTAGAWLWQYFIVAPEIAMADANLAAVVADRDFIAGQRGEYMQMLAEAVHKAVLIDDENKALKETYENHKCETSEEMAEAQRAAEHWRTYAAEVILPVTTPAAAVVPVTYARMTKRKPLPRLRNESFTESWNKTEMIAVAKAGADNRAERGVTA